MKVQVKVAPRVFVEADGKTQTEIFESLASLQEVFGSFSTCGKCKSDDLRFVVRTDNEDNKYYELHCRKCFARLAFGQNKGEKAGTLFPHVRENKKGSIMGLEPGTYLPDGGWLRWNKQKGKSE
jgi:hypothetical protein